MKKNGLRSIQNLILKRIAKEEIAYKKKTKYWRSEFLKLRERKENVDLKR